MKKVITGLFLIILIGLLGCKKNPVLPAASNSTTIPGTKIAPDGFNFNTAKTITLNLTLQSAHGEALSGVIVSVYNPASINADNAIFKGATDLNGKLMAQISVPTWLTKVVIDPAYLGLLHYAQANINNNAITATIGGPTGFGGDIIPEPIVVPQTSSQGLTLSEVYQLLPFPKFSPKFLNSTSGHCTLLSTDAL